jgi:hypothetical protein
MEELDLNMNVEIICLCEFGSLSKSTTERQYGLSSLKILKKKKI